ncbi:hypothetical protein LUZ60_010468 [Juncus effusus]|nr:hypothetical protein LUZ60_010468 [Juncus effusus]
MEGIAHLGENVEEFEAPALGMQFATKEEARDYYEEYGRRNGFGIRTRSTHTYNGQISDAKFVCVSEGVNKDLNKSMVEKGNGDVGDDGSNSKEGGLRKRKTSTIRCDCDAFMRIKFNNFNGVWAIINFDDSHNHKLVSPCKRIRLKSNRTLPSAVKNLATSFHFHNMVLSKIPEIFGGATIGYDSRDIYNYMLRSRNIDGGDTQGVMTYFRQRQAQNPQFFYAIQCDASGRAINFFWVEARARMSYQYFGDVVSFDTTYRTNKYRMPFAPFTGINHHRQSIQFGCALMQDETEVSFKWVFETWLEAMGGRHPKAILTDQDLAMKKAIADVFPDSRHRLCLWHIMKKFGEKLSHVYNSKSPFKNEIQNCI